jgi:hypothetical protein
VLSAQAVNINQFDAVKAACVQSAQRSFLMKTKRFFLFGLPAVLLALGLVLATSLTLVGCGEEDESSTIGSGATATISGTPKIGNTLNVTFTGFAPYLLYITWKSGGATGEGTTITYGSDSYTIQASQVSVGEYIWVEASNNVRSVKVTSARIGPVQAADPE